MHTRSKQFHNVVVAVAVGIFMLLLSFKVGAQIENATTAAEQNKVCDTDDARIEETEKALPGSPGKYIVATLIEANKPRGKDYLVYDLLVRVESRTEGLRKETASVCLPIIAHQNDLIMSDRNYGDNGVDIDTGRYFVRNGSRAFGVRLNFHKRVTAGNLYESHQVLYLFEQREDAIFPVLRNLIVKLMQSHANGDPIGTGIYTQSRSLLILESSHLGYQDILVKETESVGIFGPPTPDERREGVLASAVDKIVGRSRWKLSFDGQGYTFPKELEPNLYMDDRRPSRLQMKRSK